MKRTPLKSDPEKRRQFVERGRQPIERNVSVAPINRERKAKLAAEQFGDGPYAAWLRSLPCVCCGRWEKDRIHVHHVKSRAAGGTERDLVPLMYDCHDRGHVGGWQTFERRAGVDLRMEADALWLRWRSFATGTYGFPPGR